MDGVVTLPRTIGAKTSADLALRLMLLAAGVGAQMSGKTLGLLGYDATARDLAHRAHHGFGMEVLVFAEAPVPPAALMSVQGRQVHSLDAALAHSDVVSVHASDIALTGAKLDLMGEHAVLIDSAHGTSVDELALAQSLMFGLIAGAGLHLIDDASDVHPMLMQCDTLVLTRGADDPAPMMPDDFLPTLSPRNRVA